MIEFVILKAFNMKIHTSKAYKINKILWYPPLIFWTKCNSNGAARGSHGNAACGGVFRDDQTKFLGCYASNIGLSFVLHTELIELFWILKLLLIRVDIIFC
jgi:hypothetical protein